MSQRQSKQKKKQNRRDSRKPANGSSVPSSLTRRLHQALVELEAPRDRATGPTSGSTELAAVQPKGTLEQIGHEADAAWRGVKKIMSLLNTELKHVYYNATNTNVTQVGTVLDLTSLISQGVGGTQRVGDSLKIKRVRVKWTFGFSGAATTVGAGTFVLGMSRDGVPAVADVFAVQSNTSGGQAFPSDTYDKADHWVLSKTAVVDQYRPYHYAEFEHTFNHDVVYTNAATTASSGAVWFAFISNEPTNFPSVQLAMDIAFLDN